MTINRIIRKKCSDKGDIGKKSEDTDDDKDKKKSKDKMQKEDQKN